MSHNELDSSTGAGEVLKDAICSQCMENCGKRRPREKSRELGTPQLSMLISSYQNPIVTFDEIVGRGKEILKRVMLQFSCKSLFQTEVRIELLRE